MIKNYDDLCVILTSCVKPSNNVYALNLVDEKKRLRQYMKSVDFLISKTSISKIVLCDNSGVGIEEYFGQNDRLEILSFMGKTVNTDLFGKGYGEGEIIEYALKNSKFIKESKYLLKITGRLVFENINFFISKIDFEKTYFNVFKDWDNRIFVDTRIWAMRTEIFKNNFMNSYKKVNDIRGQFLEYVYGEVLLDSMVEWSRFPVFIEISGVSGSSGKEYKYPNKYKSVRKYEIEKEYSNQEKLILDSEHYYLGFRFNIKRWNLSEYDIVGKKVILYCAGMVGKEWYKSFFDYCSIVTWVDRRYAQIGSIYYEKIEAPEVVNEMVCDLIVVATNQYELFEEIRESIGQTKKIVWARLLE